MGIVSEELGIKGGKGETQSNPEEIITPLMNATKTLRDNIKSHAIDGKGQIFKICDEFRDEILPELGIRLEDKGTDSTWKYEDKDLLIMERETKKKQKTDKERLNKERKEAELKKV